MTDRPQWQNAKLVRKQEVAHEIFSLTFEFETAMHFHPGQYVNVRVSIDGRERPIQRAYSIASPSSESKSVEIIVSLFADGLASPILTRTATVGQVFSLRGPHGDFMESLDTERRNFFIGAGTGITPFLSLVRTNVPSGRTTLLYSSRTAQHEIAVDEMTALASRAASFRFARTTTRERTPRSDFDRRIDSAMLRELDATVHDAFYLCGPPTMVESVANSLEEVGVDSAWIETEKYT